MQPAVTLLFLVCVHSAKGQGDFWWLGTQAFGGQAGNNGVERVKNDDQGSKGNVITWSWSYIFIMSIYKHFSHPLPNVRRA